jgi:hypothetical protein
LGNEKFVVSDAAVAESRRLGTIAQLRGALLTLRALLRTKSRINYELDVDGVSCHIPIDIGVEVDGEV